MDGKMEILGAVLGVEGLSEGIAVGLPDGAKLGELVGVSEGDSLGESDGKLVVGAVGLFEGDMLGD